MLPKKLPSRPWLIFWTASSFLATTAYYDSSKKSQILKQLTDQASVIAAQPMHTSELPRKLLVFVAPSQYARHTFEKYVKPVFDAAALDYDMVEPRESGQVQKQVRELIWTGKEESTKRYEQYKPTTSKSSSWNLFKEKPQKEQIDPIKEFLERPKYNPNHHIVAVGTDAWKEVLSGINEGCLSARQAEQPAPIKKEDDEKANEEIKKQVIPLSQDNMPIINNSPSSHPSTDNSISLPTLGFIPGRNLVGWKYFPYRIFRWFVERDVLQEIGTEALKIALNEKTRGISYKDIRLGCGSGMVGTTDFNVGDNEGILQKDMKEVCSDEIREKLEIII